MALATAESIILIIVGTLDRKYKFGLQYFESNFHCLKIDLRVLNGYSVIAKLALAMILPLFTH